jgi:hemolysin III
MHTYSPREEILNAGTHGLGLAAGLAAGIVLIVLTALTGHALSIVAASVFTATVVLLFLASTLYHAIPHPTAKARLKVLDHAAIYLLIAGTYTPFTLVGLGGTWGWSLFGVVWGLAVVGVGFKLFFTGRFRLASTLVYIAMGWLALVAIEPMVERLSPVVLTWLFVGGACYTVGTLFYLAKRLPYAHAVWHLFVLGGCVSHFVAAYALLLGPSAGT